MARHGGAPAPTRDPGERAGESLDFDVVEAPPRDAGRAIARLDPADLDRLAARPGDILEITGQTSALARALPAYPEQRGARRIHVDGMLREDTGSAPGDAVKVRLVRVNPARSLTLAPAGPGARARAGAPEQVARALVGLPAQKGLRLRTPSLGDRPPEFIVVETVPPGPVLVGASTRIKIQGEPVAPRRSGEASFEDIGGLRQEIGRIREMIELPLKHPEVFDHLGISAPRGVLLHGAPGCGKTLIARAVAHETSAHFITVSGPEIVHKLYGESEAHLRQIFETASKRAPAIIFIDEIDAIVPKRADLGSEKQVEHRVVAQLLALMDGLASRGQVVVIGATNIPDALDPALRRPGRFDREIRVGVPDQSGRLEILQIHTRGMPLAGVELAHLAAATPGFVGADLEALCREAAMHALRAAIARFDPAAEEISPADLATIVIGPEDFRASLAEVEPSALREVCVEIPDVRWDHVGGLQEAKRALQETIVWPLAHPDLVRQVGARPSRGILLSGKPGTGKTLLAQAVATESGVNFISVGGPALLSRYVGESERGLREVFRKARQAAPCLLFFDEMDGLVGRRGRAYGESVTERVLSQFLSELDGITRLEGVVVVGATNRPDQLDPALLRPGRFDIVLDMPEPDAPARLEILSIHTRHMPLAPDADLGTLAGQATDGLVGADLESLVARAGWLAIREHLDRGSAAGPHPVAITGRHLDDALAWVRSQQQRRVQWARA